MHKILILLALFTPVAACQSPTKAIKRDSNEIVVDAEAGAAEAESLDPHVAEEGKPILRSIRKRFIHIKENAQGIIKNAEDVKDKPNWFVAQFERLGRWAMWAVLAVVAWFVLKLAVNAGKVPFASSLLTGLAKKGLGVTKQVKTQATLLAKTKVVAKESRDQSVIDPINSTITAFREQSPAHEGAYLRAKKTMESPEQPSRVRPTIR